MAKLNQRKIRWIVKQWNLGELSHYQIAKQQKISVRHAARVAQKYKGIQQPKLLNPGRQTKTIPKQQIELVKKIV